MAFSFFGDRAESRIHLVPAAEVKTWVDSGQVVLIDVREPNEHAAEAIPGAVNLPLSTFDPAQLPPVPEGKKLVFHCRSGVRCGTAAERAMQLGYGGEIHRLEGGIFGWKAAGGPTV
ncbi:MAG TPA: rhodanese-like domain-containing protein [Magnetospirillum sp.]|jgi:rhodanese-related sulfurtransferase|nr:rhodanese-like domain-containing protein [Magnetospirillum sp.]